MSVQVVTFGCRLNTYESSAMKAFKGIDEDIIIVNTCAVTQEAERQCRQTIRKLKRENPESFLVVTGCAAQVHPELYAKMPEVDRVLGNREKLNPENFNKDKPSVLVSDLETFVAFDPPEPVLFEDRSRAFLQIQQGCNNHCTFCIIPQARGKSVYLKKENILLQTKKIIENGYHEVVLTGVDITDFPDFSALVKSLIELKGLKRLRLGSLDPACIDESLIELFASSEVLMPHLHLSIQSGDDMILKRMGRRHLRKDVILLCEKLRKVRPDIAFGADFITGFPTETELMFENTLELVKTADITHLHVFPYSERSGTPAAKMPQVEKALRKMRAKKLREVGENLLFNYMQGKIGSHASVLYEKEGRGLSEHYLTVEVPPLFSSGDIVEVQLSKIKEAGVFEGSVLSQ